jgi:hypothetical protein
MTKDHETNRPQVTRFRQATREFETDDNEKRFKDGWSDRQAENTQLKPKKRSVRGLTATCY